MASTKKETTKVSKTKNTAALASQGRKKETKKENRFDLQRYSSAIRANFTNNRRLYIRYLIITTIVILVAAFLIIKKDWFVAAVVNNQPITTVEFYQNLKAKDGQAVLDQLIRDKLITQEANRKGINVSSSDIDKKIESVQKQLGGKEALQAALSQRNLSQTDFRNQLKIQLLVEKLLGDQISVTDKEVEDYIAKNPAETKDQNKDDVKNQLKSTKLNDKFTPWYKELQKNSKIYKFV